ncbi:LysR family transcriptional regulator [Aliamphritea hakodatensis]|uniref:LysR family transcriptional regulator n=1 Tax=Aliamphritea hakodatensis TaxID=2895352 RepID=UPI0022FD72A8|nr:LysR family transcriptional regulator [Aliamphritea hakodatensis]
MIKLVTITFNDGLGEMYNLEQLRMFAETVESGSFSASARKLGKVQSAVSQGIANLEIDLGVELFDRTTRKPQLTAEGARLLVHAQSVLSQIDDLNTTAAGINRGEEVRIRIALEDAILVPRLSLILTAFGERFQATTIEVLSAPSPDVANLVLNGRANIGLMFSEMEIEKGVDQCFIGNLPFYAVCEPTHPLTRLASVAMRDLVPHRQLMMKGKVGQGLDQFPPLSTDIWSATSFHVIREMVIQGVGWSYLPGHLVDQEIEAGRLHRMNLSFDHKPWSPPVELVMQKNQVMGPALLWLSEALKELFS